MGSHLDNSMGSIKLLYQLRSLDEHASEVNDRPAEAITSAKRVAEYKPVFDFIEARAANHKVTHTEPLLSFSPDNCSQENVRAELATTGLYGAALTEMAFRTSGLTVSFGGAA